MAEQDELDLSMFRDLPEMDFPAPENTELTDKDIEDVKEFTIGEVESLEEFQKQTATKKEVTSTPDDPEIEEETEIETPENTGEEAASEEGTEEVSPIRAIAEWAGTKGIIDFDPEKFEDSEDYLETKLNDVVKSKVEAYKQDLPEVLHDLINNFEEGVPLMELIDSKSRQIEFSAIDEDTLEKDVDLQKNILRQHLANQDYKEDAIEKKIKRLEDNLLLEEESKEALEKLKVFEEKYQQNLIKETQERKKQAEKEWQDTLKNIEKTIMTADEIIPGIKLTKEEKQKLYDGYIKFDAKRETQLTKALKADPLANLKIAQFFLLLNGDVSNIKTKLKTEVTREVKKTVNTYKEKDTPFSKVNLGKIQKALELAKQQRRG